MLYSPGTRLGLISALREMSEKLDLSDTDDSNLFHLSETVLSKLESMTDSSFVQLDPYSIL